MYNIFREGARKVLRLLSMWDKTFKRKLKESKIYETLVKNCLQSYAYEAEYTPLEDQHKGDLLVYDVLTDDSFYLEVKKDTRVSSTGNIYLELQIDRPNGTSAKGWYYYDYTYLAVVDASPKTKSAESSKPIFLIDFAKMKAELDLNDPRCTQHTHKCDENQNTALLVPLRYIQSRGWLVDTYYYNAEDWNKARAEASERNVEND
ncbi:MAG: hypothetical protein ACI4PM_01965 [Butyricicoccus sp.]